MDQLVSWAAELIQILAADLGARPSFTWRNILSVCDLVLKGSRWLISNGHSVSVWDNPWLPHPFSLRPIRRPDDGSPSWKVADLIDFNLRSWKEDVIRTSFLTCDAEEILNILLCHLWSCDKFIWHFLADREFTVRFAYQLAQTLKGSSNA